MEPNPSLQRWWLPASQKPTQTWKNKAQPPRLPPTPLPSSSLTSAATGLQEALQANNLARQEALQANLARVEALDLPSFGAPTASALPSWLSTALPSLELRARVVDFWSEHQSVSHRMSCYLTRLGFHVDFVTNATQEPSACAFVAARVVNDLHAAGEHWWTCDVRRAAEHQWVQAGNLLLGRTMPNVIDCGFMASNEQVDHMVEGFWQNDAPREGRSDCSTWFPRPGAAVLDCVLADLVEDLYSVATGAQADLALRLRVPNTVWSTHGGGIHWFTIAYSIRHTAPNRTATLSAHTGANVDVSDGTEAQDVNMDVSDEVRMEMEPEGCIWDEECMIDSDDEMMEREMYAGRYMWSVVLQVTERSQCDRTIWSHAQQTQTTSVRCVCESALHAR